MTGIEPATAWLEARYPTIRTSYASQQLVGGSPLPSTQTAIREETYHPQETSSVRPPGLEPGTYGLKVRSSTN